MIMIFYRALRPLSKAHHVQHAMPTMPLTANLTARLSGSSKGTDRGLQKPVEFYATAVSPPGRAAWMGLETMGVKYELRDTNPGLGQTKTAEYIKLNPQRTIPTLVDEGLVITESKAILMHLARKYDNSFYPEDIKQKALIDQRLFFDQSYIWGTAGKIFVRLFLHQEVYKPWVLDNLLEAIHWCEDFVKPTGFIAGTPNMSIADIATLASYTSLRACKLLPTEELPGLEAWAERCKAMVKNYDTCNQAGVYKLGKLFRISMEKQNVKTSS